MDLDPLNALSWVTLGTTEFYMGHLDQASADVKKALELDPLSARSHRSLGVFLYVSGDYEGAIAAFERALELEPDIKHSHYLLGLTLLQVGRFMEAVAAIRKSFERSVPGVHLGALVAAYAASGREQEANEALRQLQHLWANSFVSPVEFVYAYAGLGRKSDALDWLEKAYEERSVWVSWLKVDPMWDPLRSNPRFQALYQKMNFPP